MSFDGMSLGEYQARLPEAAFQQQVVNLARACGWRVYHALPGRHRSGKYATPTMGHVGFPDVVAARGGRLVCAELKSARGTISGEQRAWLDVLGEVESAEVYVWRPRDIEQVKEVLA